MCDDGIPRNDYHSDDDDDEGIDDSVLCGHVRRGEEVDRRPPDGRQHSADNRQQSRQQTKDRQK
jgi:hypothetical protein